MPVIPIAWLSLFVLWMWLKIRIFVLIDDIYGRQNLNLYFFSRFFHFLNLIPLTFFMFPFLIYLFHIIFVSLIVRERLTRNYRYYWSEASGEMLSFWDSEVLMTWTRNGLLLFQAWPINRDEYFSLKI